MNGFLLIDKPKDWTSRDVCNKISHLFNTKKVGHIGTLDPFATGLLIVALGEATKAIPYLEDSTKTYEAKLCLGIKTNTGDLTGEVVDAKPVPNLNIDFIENTLRSFLGESKQLPPMTSAIKMKGQTLYKLAHKGIEIERKERVINIYDINLLNKSDDNISFATTVSKGTYIRTLGEDIALKLGTIGHLKELRRTQIGPFSITESCNIEDIKDINLITIPDILKRFMDVKVVSDKKALDKISNGAPLDFNFDTKYDKILLVSSLNLPLAIYSYSDGKYICERGFVNANN